MALTVKLIGKLGKGRYHDGHGLYLQVMPPPPNNKTATPSRSWTFRYKRKGVEHWLGLGPWPAFSLKEARRRAMKATQQLCDGIDPIVEKRKARDAQALEDAKHLTFQEATQQYYDSHEHEWTSAVHRQQFLSSMTDYAFPVIGKLPVALIDTPLVLNVLRPIWKTKHVTATRVRARIESVLSWASVSGLRSGDNPARWNGHLKEVLSTKGNKVAHHAAMAYTDVPNFVAALATRKGIEPKAMEYLILTASRYGEVVNARWNEIDVAAKIWTVPAARMKTRIQHRVPLPDRAIKILQGLPREAGNDLVFLGARKGRPLGKNALLDLCKAMGHDVTVHGFRSSFRDWCSERTNVQREICEAALSHRTGDDTELAYKRTDQLEKRRRLMDMWSKFCAAPQRSASVTPIGKRA
jgi:integrase